MNTKNKEIKEGQIWKFNNAENTFVDANVIIRKIELMIFSNHNAHVSIKNLKNDGKYLDVEHLPMNLESLINSLKSMSLMEKESINSDQSLFFKGYEYWKDANGGVWETSLKDAIIKTLNF